MEGITSETKSIASSSGFVWLMARFDITDDRRNFWRPGSNIMGADLTTDLTTSNDDCRQAMLGMESWRKGLTNTEPPVAGEQYIYPPTPAKRGVKRNGS